MKLTFILISVLMLPLFGRGQQLQGYIEEALRNNPSIQAYELRHSISREKVNEAGGIPDTQFSAGLFVSEPETRTGAQKARFSARQLLPWFGTISRRKEYARAQADSEFVNYTIECRKLKLEVSDSYYRLYGLKARQRVYDTQIELLKSYEALTLNRVAVNKAGAVDILTLQIRQNELSQQKRILQEQFAAEQSRFNHLLNRKAGEPVEVWAELRIPSEDPVAPERLQVNPELMLYDALYKSVVQEERLNRKESAPSLGIGLDYIPVQERSDLLFSDNGKDILMPMVSLSIPLFNPRYLSRSQQNEFRKQEISLLKQQRMNTLQTRFAQVVGKRNEARITFDTQSLNLKQARDAEEILLRQYETGAIPLRQVLEIQELQLDIQSKQIQAVQLYFQQSAVINYLIH